MSLLKDIALDIVAAIPIGWQKEQKKHAKKEHDDKLKKIMTTKDVTDYINSSGNDDKTAVKREAVEAYIINLDDQDKKQRRDHKKINNLILNRATRLVGSYNTGEIDTELDHKINKLNYLSDQIRYKNVAIKSQKLVNYTIWVSTDKNAIGIVNFDRETKEFVNAVCKLIHADLQYKDCSYSDLNLYDPWIAGWNNQKFLINLTALKKLDSISMQERINNKNNVVTPTASVNPDLSQPVRFATPNSSNTLVDPEIAVSDNVRSILEGAVGEILEDREHWFISTPDYNVYKLFAKNVDNCIPEEFTLCLGYYGYNTVALSTIDPFGQQVFISCEDEELIEKFFNNYFYQLSIEDLNNHQQFISPLFWVYRIIDMSPISKSDIKGNLDNKLNRIFGELQMKGIDLSNLRYRFEEYNSPTDFTLISDQQVKGIYNFMIDGSMIKVKDDEAVYKVNNRFEKVSC